MTGAGTTSGYAQRLFAIKTDSTSRTYLLHTHLKEEDAGHNAPLVILLAPKGLTASDIYDRTLYAKQLYRQAVIALPNALQSDWGCASEDALSANRNAEFLVRMIEEIYRNFKINRDDITIISNGRDSCAVSRVREKYPSVQWQSSDYLGPGEFARTKLLQEIHGLLSTETPRNSAFFEPYTDPFAPKVITPLERMIEQGYYNRWVVNIRYGGMTFLKSIRTEMKEDAYLDLSKSVAPLSFGITKWFSDSTAWFLEFSRMPVSRQQKINGNSLSIGGGMMRNVTIGFKYAPLTEKRLRPYFSLATGAMWINIRGGKITMNGSPPPSTGGAPPAGRPPGFAGDQRRVFLHTTLEAGADYRLTRRLIINTSLKYLHSAQFEPLGSIKAARGFSFLIGAGYVLNARSTKKLEYLSE
ncbi:MAG: hypothetical protein ABS46_16295 [Cytophagaceae bacterium SCN 52-12]|nr:MAG: hypothetical protein ABS46_16295 [Cytophagaceae bacterium SCN 52-12]